MATHWAIRSATRGFYIGRTRLGVWFGGTEQDAVRWGNKWNAQEMLDKLPDEFSNCTVVKLTTETK